MKYQKKYSCIALRPLRLLLGLFIVSLLIWASSKNRLKVWIPGVKVTVGGGNCTKPGSTEGTTTVANDRLLGGLLLPDFDEQSCLSRYQSMLYRKASSYALSSYLISKLRTCEQLHKKCGPNTPLFQKSLQQLKSNHSTDQLECNYVLWSPLGGIGNRMLTLTSTFLYALLTNRVMLIQQAADISDLFCEPFPGSTWYIPPDFPIKNLEGYSIHSQNSYGYMVSHNLINNDPNSPPSALPPFMYVHLQFDYLQHDLHTHFFCEGDQEVINKINWVLLKSDNYIVPGLFMIPKYEQKLKWMFPIKETVFHHLGRYLLHPSNSVWGMVMRYHNSYLAQAKERIGIQARIFQWAPISIDELYKQIVACTQEQLILPEINAKQPEGSSLVPNEATTHAVLVTSLYGDFYEKLKDMYHTLLIKEKEKPVTPDEQKDKFGGLLSPSFDKESCLSRYQSALLRKASPHLPSSYLIAKLRKYEELHKRCGPYTALYHKSIIQLNSGESIELMDCNYLVWSPFNGLGYRMLTIASAFLYAVLTNRVLLIYQTEDMVDLFCEPFPDLSWILPPNFPIKNLTKLRQGSEISYSNMLRNKKINNQGSSASLPAYVYLHLEHDYQHLDKLFFCEEHQAVLQKINWLVLQYDIYFVPGLFLVPQFEDELGWMFPAKETVFHHIGSVGMITRYHTAYLARSDEKIGVQIRVFSRHPITPENYLKQILMCSRQERLLPEIRKNGTLIATKNKMKSKAVLITSLYSEYSEKLKSMYYEQATVTGEPVSINQPTHESQQQIEKQSHNQKALGEMYLLSYCDVLITSGWSTFGYIGQGLAGLKPWILLTPRDQKPVDPPCTRAVSMEPCFQVPPTYDCKTKKNGDLAVLVRHLTHCEDVGQGIKLVD